MAIGVKLFLFFFSCFCVIVSNGIDMITQVHSIKDPESIISANNTYELAFFSPLNTTNRYVGIWFRDIPVKTVVWVANRDRPLNDSSGMLAISEDGNLVLRNGKNQIFWSTSVSSFLINSTARLLDSGNLVLFDNLSRSTPWKSFQFPTDSLLESMELTSDGNTNQITLIRSWKSSLDPTVGSFSAGLRPLIPPEFIVWNGSRPFWRSGPWSGWFFNGIMNATVTYNSRFAISIGGSSSTDFVYLDGSNLVNKQNRQYGLTFVSVRDTTTLLYYALSHEGSLSEKKWNRETTEWETTWSFPENENDIYGRCGPFGSCNSKDSRICSCLRGYRPKHAYEWDTGNFTSGCVRRVPLQCDNDVFIKMTTMKLPDSPEWSSESRGAEGCENKCFKDCMCLAYSFYEGVGCISWSGTLIDTQKFSTSGANLYVRVPSSELGHKNKGADRAVIGISVAVGLTVVALCCFLYWLMIAKQRGSKTRKAIHMLKSYLPSLKSLTSIKLEGNLKHIKFEELPFFKFDTLSMATDNFFLRNKLGQGGFGAVYKGILSDGKEIAVKRLSRSSDQGSEEFTNEVVVISKLQHRNLVRLLAVALKEMKICWFMNTCLIKAWMHFYLVSTYPQAQEILDWSRRLKIIEGIGRGLLYLHRDSRLRIIHRDLKASNILLDDKLNPKISDFGMARIFGGTQNQANTQRVVGTYGYMAPEYAMNGEFSEKSDVFSFGVLLLEIVSGRRNTSFYDDDKYLSLLQYAWKMWNEDNALAIIDSRKACEEFQMEILRCIHIGLLCVQEFAVDRPTISKVLFMLSNEGLSLTKPNQPAFTQRYALARQIEIKCSLNDCSITFVEGR